MHWTSVLFIKGYTEKTCVNVGEHFKIKVFLVMDCCLYLMVGLAVLMGETSDTSESHHHHLTGSSELAIDKCFFSLDHIESTQQK